MNQASSNLNVFLTIRHSIIPSQCVNVFSKDGCTAQCDFFSRWCPSHGRISSFKVYTNGFKEWFDSTFQISRVRVPEKVSMTSRGTSGVYS
mgnify:CR=1 FL=1